MIPFFAQFITDLREMDWSNLSQSHSYLEGWLKDLNDNRDVLRNELRSHSNDQRLVTAMSSREPSTHFKWLLFRDPLLRFEVWLHEYKCRDLLRPGYAVVPHNHVYQFSSLILNGGFKHISYAVKGRDCDELSFRELNVLAETKFSKNMIYTLTSDTVHSLTSIEEQTTTLVVNSRSFKTFSEEFDSKTGRIIRHYPLPVRAKTGYPFMGQI